MYEEVCFRGKNEIFVLKSNLETQYFQEYLLIKIQQLLELIFLEITREAPLVTGPNMITPKYNRNNNRNFNKTSRSFLIELIKAVDHYCNAYLSDKSIFQ